MQKTSEIGSDNGILRTVVIAVMGAICAAVIWNVGDWSVRSNAEFQRSFLAGIGVGVAEGAIFKDLFLWAGRTVSAIFRSSNRTIPSKTSGWIWICYQGIERPLAIVQERFRCCEIGTVIAMTLVAGRECMIRATQVVLGHFSPALGIALSVVVASIVSILPRHRWYQHAFGLVSNIFIGIVHALLYVWTSDVFITVAASIGFYLFLKRL